MAGSAKKRGQTSQSLVPVAFLGGLGIVGYGMFQLVSKLTEGDFAVRGQLVATGTAHGDITLGAGTCLVGERFGYEGVFLRNATGGGVRIEAAGPVVRVEVPGTCGDDHARCQYLDVPRSSCSTFEVVTEKTNESYNRRKVWRGSLSLSCKLERGSVEASLTFPKCA